MSRYHHKIGQTLVHGRTRLGEKCRHVLPHIDFLQSKGKAYHCVIGGVARGGQIYAKALGVCLFSRRVGSRVIYDVIVRLEGYSFTWLK